MNLAEERPSPRHPERQRIPRHPERQRRISLIFAAALTLTSCTTSHKTTNFTSLPLLEESNSETPIRLGGFSGLAFLGVDGEGRYRFLTHTDRGPNGDPRKSDKGMVRPFLLPRFAPKLVEFSVDKKFATQPQIVRISPFKDASGRPLNGLPNDAHKLTPSSSTEEIPVDMENKPLPFSASGIDPEGIALATDGSLWLVEEYAPSILHFDSAGVLIERFIPKGEKADSRMRTKAVLPASYRNRPTNRGFEAVILEGTKLYAFLQSPMTETPGFVRILELDTDKKSVSGEYLYPLDPGTDHKVGDATLVGKGEFLVLENYLDTESKRQYRVYQMQLGATVFKKLHTDLTALGYDKDKPEGIAVVGKDKSVVILNDNDFDAQHFYLKQSQEPSIALWVLPGK